MKDTILRAIDKNEHFRIFIARTTDMVEEMRRIHETSTTATAALGRLLTITSIIGSDLKNEQETVTINFRGDGPGGNIVAVSDWTGNARAAADNPNVDVPSREDGHLDVGAWVGNTGRISIVRGYHLKEPFIGVTEIVSGEIAMDMANYFFYSEQTPTVIDLGVLVNTDHSCIAAGGIFVQALPFAPTTEIERMAAACDQLGSVSDMIHRGMSPEDILHEYFDDFEPTILDEREVAYVCPCNREKMERAIASIPMSDRHQIAMEDGGAEIVCHFCNKKYWFTKEELLGDFDAEQRNNIE